MGNTHEYAFNCNQCDKSFLFKNSMKLHKRYVHDESSHDCFVCKQKIKTFKELTNHQQKKWK